MPDPAPQPRRPQLDPGRAYWLHEIDAIDPEFADRIRAQQGMPLKHVKPARTASTGQVKAKAAPPAANFQQP